MSDLDETVLPTELLNIARKEALPSRDEDDSPVVGVVDDDEVKEEEVREEEEEVKEEEKEVREEEEEVKEEEVEEEEVKEVREMREEEEEVKEEDEEAREEVKEEEKEVREEKEEEEEVREDRPAEEQQQQESGIIVEEKEEKVVEMNVADKEKETRITSSIIDSRKACGGELVQKSNGPRIDSVIPYETLKSLRSEDGIDMTRKEEYLAAEEFEQQFKQDFESFKKLPMWRQIMLKKKVGLF